MKKQILLAILSMFFMSTHAQERRTTPRELWPTADTIDGIYIPRNMKECIQQLDILIPDTKQMYYLNRYKSAYDYSIGEHFGLSLWIRNEFGLWRDSRLSAYFSAKGKTHPDDIAGDIQVEFYFFMEKKHKKCLKTGVCKHIDKKRERYRTVDASNLSNLLR